METFLFTLALETPIFLRLTLTWDFLDSDLGLHARGRLNLIFLILKDNLRVQCDVTPGGRSRISEAR